MPAGSTNFPTALDTNEVLDNTDEITSTRTNNAYVQIEAIQAKVGINGSAVTTSHDYKLSGVTGTDKAVGRTYPLDGLDYQALINGSFDVWQRNTTFTTPNDDTYGPDRWNFLVETNGSWTFTRDTDVPSGVGIRYSLKATNVTLNNQCGIVQILEAADTAKLNGRTVSLSFYAKTSGTEIGNLRATVLSWDSTADSVTSDVIGTWASDGTDPTFATNWTKEIAGSNKALTSSWQRFTVENISIDTASTANVAVIIWVDDGTIAANDDFWVTGVQLNAGATATWLAPRMMMDEYRRCCRFYQTSYPIGTVPGTADGYQEQMAVFTADTTTDAHGANVFHVPMRTSPTLTLYAADAATGSGTAARVRDNTAGGLETITGTTHNAAGVNDVTTNTGFTATRSYGCNYVADAEL